MKACYADTVAVEFNNVSDREQRLWLQQHIEVHLAHRQPLTVGESERLLQGLVEAEQFEKFLQNQFRSSKRFGLEGCEVLVPGEKRAS